MQAKITKKFLDGLSNKTGKDQFYRDTTLTGFGVKVTPKGSISFIVEGRIRKRRSKRCKLGEYPVLSVLDARGKAHEFLRQYREGIDPHEKERRELERESREEALKKALGLTLRDVMESFFESRRLKSEADYRNVIDNCLGDWLDHSIRDVTRQDVEARYHKIAFKEGKKPQAAKAMRYLSSIMNYAKGEDVQGQPLITENPVQVLTDKRVDRTVKPRETYIPLNRLFVFIRAVMTECVPMVRDLLLLMLMSGLRDQEAKGLRWEDVDFQGKTFTTRDTKNKTDHTMPMGGFLYLLLLTRYHARTNDVWVYPSKRKGGYVKDIRRHMLKVTAKTGIEFTAHDLRRTFATLLNELDINDIAIKRLMNHKSKNVTERYIQTKASLYSKPMRKLYDLISVDHDWTTDEGEGKIEALLNALENEELAKLSLFYVLYGETLERLETEGVDIDWEYVDPTYHPLYGVPHEEVEKLFADEYGLDGILGTR